MRPWLVLGILLVLAAAPSAGQQAGAEEPKASPEDLARARDLVRDATVDLIGPLDLHGLEVNEKFPIDCGVRAGYEGASTVLEAVPLEDVPVVPFGEEDVNVFAGANTTVDPTVGNISFEERADQGGCGLVAGEFDTPVGAPEVRISFDATRTIVSEEEQVNARFVQEFRFANSGARNQSIELFPPETRAGSQEFQESYTLTGGKFQIAWLFADLGFGTSDTAPGVGNLGSGQRCVGTITNVTVAYPFVPVRADAAPAGHRDVELTREYAYTVDVFLSPLTLGTAAAIIRLELAPGADLERIEGPFGNSTIPDDLYTVTLESGQSGPTVVVLGKGEVIDPGNYRFHVKTVMPLEPQVIPEPTKVGWLLASALPIPAVAGLFSTRASVLAWRNTTGGYQRSARGVLAMVAFLAIVYLAAIALLLVIGRPAMTVLPLSAVAVAGYGLLALLFLGFLLLLQRANVVAARDAAAQRRAQAEALKRSNEELEQFAYVASHDLQEPLRTVANFSTLLQRRYGGKLGPEGEEFIGHTVAGAKRMQRLIQDLLAYSRVGQDPRPLVPVSLGQSAQQAIGDLNATIQATKARIELAELPVVQGDATQLEQLFTNLIGNALKYRDATRAPIVRISAQRRGADWVVSVADNGIGIAPEHRTRIFQVFQRLHGRDVEGTGIGLAICQKIVVRHGGRIWVESEPGKGSTFLFTVPVTPPQR